MDKKGNGVAATGERTQKEPYSEDQIDAEAVPMMFYTSGLIKKLNMSVRGDRG